MVLKLSQFGAKKPRLGPDDATHPPRETIMKNDVIKSVLCWSLSLSISFLPAVRLGAASGCDNAVVAGVLFDHISTTWLSEESLVKLSSLSVRELQDLDPTAELETLKKLWQSIQLMKASQAKRLEGIEAAKAQFVEAVGKDKSFIERLELHLKVAARIHETELNLSSLNDRFALTGTERISTLTLTNDLADHLVSINFSKTLQRYLGHNLTVMDYITNSAQAVPFRRWMITNILHPNDEFYALMRGVVLDAQNTSIPMPQLQVFLNYTDDQLNALARSLYQHINRLDVDVEHPNTLIYHLFNHYARQTMQSKNPAQIAYQFAKDIQKIDPSWAASGLDIASMTPDSLRGVIPMLYLARNQISAADNGQSFLEALLFYDLITSPPASIASRLQNPEAFASLVSNISDLRFGGYIQARTPAFNIAAPFGVATQDPPRAGLTVGLAIIQLAYAVASVGGLVPLPGWLAALMGAYMVGVRPSIQAFRP